jgi:DNA polymerase-3 subunit beta
MELRLKRSNILAELAPMQGVVERKTTIPVLSHILLEAREKRVDLKATDLDVSLTSYCDADVKHEGGIAVQARKFMEIVRSLPDDDVLLMQEDPKILSIHGGQSRFKLNGLAPEDFPTLADVGSDERIEISFPEFRSMISKVIFAVSAEESRFQLNGALLLPKEESFEMVATDGHRLALVESSLGAGAKAFSDGVLVPRKALQELLRFEGDDTLVFCRGEHHLSFEIGRRTLICRILEGTFPDHERAIAKDNDKQVVFDTKSLLSTVQRVALLTGDRARAVRLQISSGLLVVSTANPDVGEAVEELECEYEGSDIRLGINPDYLCQFLAVVESEKVRLEVKDENSQCVGYPVETTDKRYLCVIMPMRI